MHLTFLLNDSCTEDRIRTTASKSIYINESLLNRRVKQPLLPMFNMSIQLLKLIKTELAIFHFVENLLMV